MSLRVEPCEFVRQFLIDKGHVTLPSANATENDWPCYLNTLPDGSGVEDGAVGVWTTQGTQDGRLMSGVVVEHPGIQIQVRSRVGGEREAYTLLANIMDELALAKQELVSVNVGGPVTARLTFTRRSGVFSLPKDDKQRSYYSANGLLTIV